MSAPIRWIRGWDWLPFWRYTKVERTLLPIVRTRNGKRMRFL